MRIGVLTGGGDCPGLNAAVRAVVFRAAKLGHTTIGFLDGWKGARDGVHRPLEAKDVAELVGRGGTVLGTSRTNPFKRPEEAEQVLRSLRDAGVDALVAIGGDDTLTAALQYSRRGGRIVGVPKTMDNDVGGTDWTFGFDSASTVAVDALERLRDTAGSHHRVVVLEVMGRHAGWVALATGLGAGADATLLPEEPYDEGALVRRVQNAVALRGCATVVVSEGVDIGRPKGAAGAHDDFGHEILGERHVGEELAKRVQERTGIEARSAAIGHIQRGGAPTLFDRLLASRLGARAVDLLNEGKFGQMAVLRGAEIVGVPLEEALREVKMVPAAWRELLHTFDP